MEIGYCRQDKKLVVGSFSPDLLIPRGCLTSYSTTVTGYVFSLRVCSPWFKRSTRS